MHLYNRHRYLFISTMQHGNLTQMQFYQDFQKYLRKQNAYYSTCWSSCIKVLAFYFLTVILEYYNQNFTHKVHKQSDAVKQLEAVWQPFPHKWRRWKKWNFFYICQYHKSWLHCNLQNNRSPNNPFPPEIIFPSPSLL